ncbi:MAG: DUF222 domain-containing protein [Gammaproteobacteria bacterium]|nr:DUF222 domain-containing protein [Gammaproteobacteria bacterium]
MSTAIAMLETQARSSSSDGEQLGAEITKLCSYIYAAEARLLNLIRIFDERKYWEELGLCSCAHWLNFKCGIGMNAAREKVRVAHALTDLPRISMAFEKGELSYSKVRAMTRIADSSNEDYLLMIAHHGTAHHVEKLVSKFRSVKKLNAQDDVGEASSRDITLNRELTHYYDHDGCLVIKARLPAEQGALIVKALEMAMDVGAELARDIFGNTVGAHPVGARLARDNHGTDVYPKGTWTAVTPNEPLPIAARRADALAEIAETYMNNSESSGSTADRYQVVVHVPVGARLARDNSHDDVGASSWRETDHAHIEHGPHVTAVTSQRIACDCSIVGIKEDENGKPLSIGRRSRSIPPPMRRALRARDGGCRFPGCTNTRFVDGHHIKHWADGGETGLDNLVLLCRHHHHLVHEGGFACERSADGEIYFKDQRAQPLADWSVLPSIADHRDVQAWLDREFFESDIDSETCTAKWLAGERMDWQMAVSALC